MEKRQFITLVVLIVVLGTIGVYSKAKEGTFGEIAQVGVERPLTASSTAFTLTTASTQILSTTTTGTPRTAVQITPVSCPATSAVFWNWAGNTAIANTGNAFFASTTNNFGSGYLPVNQSSMKAITNAGTCVVLVTEWRSGQ